MDFNLLAKTLLLNDEQGKFLEPHYSESLNTLPKDSRDIHFIQTEFIENALIYCRVKAELHCEILAFAKQISDDRALHAYAWSIYHHLALSTESPPLNKWPALHAYLKQNWACIHLVAALGCIPTLKAKHAALGIPADTTQDTCEQFSCYINNFANGNDGRPGIESGSLNWLQRYPSGNMFRCGRLEFMHDTFHQAPIMLRHKSSGCSLLFSGAGLGIDQHGFRWNDKKFHVQETEYKEADNYIEGHVCLPTGNISSKTLRASLEEWNVVLRHGDAVLDMHIPSGGGMKPDLCFESFRKGFALFDQYFSDRPICKAVNCASWIFNTQLEDILPTSNLTEFIQSGYCYPFPSAGNDGLRFVYNREYPSLDEYPQRTSLERGLIRVLKSGDKLRTGGWLFLRDDLEHATEKIYRQHSTEINSLLASA